MKKYKVKHWNGGNIDYTIVSAPDMSGAMYIYLMYHNVGDIIEITEVTE